MGGVQSTRVDLLLWNVAADRFAVFPTLEVVIRALRAFTQDTEFARLHTLDLSDLLKNFGQERRFHGANIYICIYYATKNHPLRYFSFIRSCAHVKAKSAFVSS